MSACNRLIAHSHARLIVRAAAHLVNLALTFGAVSETAAADLLATITFDQPLEVSGGDPPPTIPASFLVQNGGNITQRAGYLYAMGPANLGTTFNVPTALVAEIAEFLERPTAFFFSDIGFSTRNGQGLLDDLLTNGWDRGPIVRHVPRIGPGLVGYDVTDITVTVDEFASLKNPINPDLFVHGGQHTIRIYGNAIPEPATASLAAVAAIVAGRKVHRRRQ